VRLSTGYVHERNKHKMTKVTNIRDAITEQIARVREALKDRVHSKVAEATGLHVNTVRNIAKNSNQKFSLATIEKLENYLFGEKV
jgi:uncharacterized alkaline shock family protein YloU